jgi:uncharacterized protein YcbX
MTKASPRVSALYVYPVKSCAGIQVPKAFVTSTGFAWDRHWMIVKDTNGKFITQRQETKLVHLKPSMPLEAFTAPTDKPPAGAALTLEAPDMEPLQVPLVGPAGGAKARLQVSCWEWKGEAEDEGDAAAAWLTKYLGKPHRLVRYAGHKGVPEDDTPAARRAVEQDWAPGHNTAFPDGFPMLIISQASVDNLNSKLEHKLSMNRFRPNIVVEGCEPWAEDNWEKLAVGEQQDGSGQVQLSSVKPCARCTVTCTDQESGVVSKEPLQTLSTFRSGKKLGWTPMPSWKGDVFVGWNLVTDQPGQIAEGDALTIAHTRTGPIKPLSGGFELSEEEDSDSEAE